MSDLRQLVMPDSNRSIALVTRIDFLMQLHQDIPERQGRFVSGYGQFVPDALPVDVGNNVATQFNIYFSRAETILMAKPKKNAKYERIEYEFVRGDMTSDQKAEAKVWIDKMGADQDALVGDLLSSDYKLSLSYDDYNDAFICSLTGKKDNKYNEGKILTGRGKTWYLALMSCLFKHYILFKGQAWLTSNAGDDDIG